MIDKKLDIWSMYGKAPICITTNGSLKANGSAVVGKGVAEQACSHIPRFSRILGIYIRKYGNVVQTIQYPPEGVENSFVLSFPVKPIMGVCAYDKKNIVPHMRHYCNVGDYVSGWVMLADIEMIQRSLWELRNWRSCRPPISEVYLPRPGCGAGGLDWEIQVKPLCAKYGDWLVCVTL